MSGDLDNEIDGEISSEGKRAKRIVIGRAETKVSVKTMSGDLEIKASGASAPDATEASSMPQSDSAWPPADRAEDVERTEPMEPVPPAAPAGDVRDLLERVAKGEIDVDAAAAALDARREH